MWVSDGLPASLTLSRPAPITVGRVEVRLVVTATNGVPCKAFAALIPAILAPDNKQHARWGNDTRPCGNGFVTDS
jgi:hypothetical protein